MMKVLAVALLIAFSFSASAQNYCGGSIKGGDGRPWPWGNETKYPLKSMQGVWQTVTGDCKNQFIFKVADTASGKVFKVMQYDPISCKQVGAGSGFLNDKIVVAQMNQKGAVYNMTIHVFNESDLHESSRWPHAQNYSSSSITQNLAAAGKYVYVISLYPIGNWDEKTTYQIVKVDASTNMICQ